MLTVQPGDGLVKVDLTAKGPPAMDAVVLREWDGPQGRMQECQVDPPHGLRFKRKANQIPVPRSKALPGQKPPQNRQQKVRLVARVLAADAAAAPRPALAPLTKGAGAEPAAARLAAAQPQQPAASGASATQAPAAVPAPAQRSALQQQQQDIQMAEAVDADADADADTQADAAAAAPAQAPTAAPAAEPETAASVPAAAAAATELAAVAAAEAETTAAATATPAARPAVMAMASHTAAAKPQAVTPAAAAEGAGADMAAVALRSGFTHEEIHAVLDQLPDGTPEERQAAQAALLARSELEAAVAALRSPAGGAAAGEGGGDGEAPAAGEPASAEAAEDAEVAAALAALLPDILAAAPQIAAPEAPVAAALAAVHKRRQEAADAGGDAGAGFALMTPGRLAAEKQALRARKAALKEELAQWEALQQQAAVLSPGRAAAPEAATGPPIETTDESAAVAAARAEAHQQLTLQVEGLCAMVEGVTALLAKADATTSQLQAAYEAAAFGSLPHVDSPATLVRRAIRPLPPPPTPAAERAAREA